MGKKANTKKKKLLTIALVFAVVLAVTATTWCTMFSPPPIPRTFEPPSTVASKCTVATENYDSGCDLLKGADTNKDGRIDDSELDYAAELYNDGYRSAYEYKFVATAYAKGSIKALCPTCYP